MKRGKENPITRDEDHEKKIKNQVINTYLERKEDKQQADQCPYIDKNKQTDSSASVQNTQIQTTQKQHGTKGKNDIPNGSAGLIKKKGPNLTGGSEPNRKTPNQENEKKEVKVKERKERTTHHYPSPQQSHN